MGSTVKSELQVYFKPDGYELVLSLSSDLNAYNNAKFHNDYLQNKYLAIYNLGFSDTPINMPSSILYLQSIGKSFINAITKNPEIEITRDVPALSAIELLNFVRNAPFANGKDYIDATWVSGIWDGMCQIFRDELKEYDTVQAYISVISPETRIFGRVYFHLVESDGDEKYPFAFLATYSTLKSFELENKETRARLGFQASSINTARAKEMSEQSTLHMPLKNALTEFKDDKQSLLKLLTTVTDAAEKSAFISELVNNGEIFSPLKLTADEAYTFLQEIPLYEESGIKCRIPNWWRSKSSSVQIKVIVGEQEPAKIGLNEIISFDSSIYFNGEAISKEEIEEILKGSQGLSLIKGKWVEVDHNKLNSVLDAYDKVKKDGITFAEALKFSADAKGSESFGNDGKSFILGDKFSGNKNDDVNIEVSNGTWLDEFKSKLKTGESGEKLEIGKDFKATLRAYQEKGVSWLNMMRRFGFGALLADDMGLGKTVQVLALLEYIRQNQNKDTKSCKTLLIVPASLMGNWEKEILKFAPKLKYTIIHTNRKIINTDKFDIFITTYAMTSKVDALKEQKWDIVVIDEAQAIKNPSTKQTQSVKMMSANFKIAMTGTPIENRLSDLWSIFDFLNAGLLGNASEFTNFSKELARDNNFAKLKDAVSPFILRRVKTDKTIISDLPEKMEIKKYANMSKKQVALYKTLVNELKEKLETAKGIERKGLVLASIIKFKQICNHPDQYLGIGKYEPAYSGKFELLSEICEIIKEKRERVIVFTQFREITTALAEFLKEVFGEEGLVLHGGVSVNKRTQLVQKFNAEEYTPFMVLSIKAGGVGLNLTSANHVIHFDRWWNPAVENQATDRVFRIGQSKDVFVHKFITTGTIEDKIDALLESKSKLTMEIIGEESSEKWITEMDNDELMELFKLG